MKTFPDPRLLMEAGEPFAAGLCELPEAAPFERYARAYRRWLEHGPLAPHAGTRLYPAGPKPASEAVAEPNYSYTFGWNPARIEARLSRLEPAARQSFQSLRELLATECRKIEFGDSATEEHFVGGKGYTHAIVNYGRVLAEGLDGYEERVQAGLAHATGETARGFYKGLLDLLAGVHAWHARSLELLRSVEPRPEALIAALEWVPFRPARSFYEAMAAYNFIYYLDGCDNPGCMDAVLEPYYEAAPCREEALALVSEFAGNVSANGGWTAALGGSRPGGAPRYLEMTGIVLASTHGRYRPTLDLRVRPDMPDQLWDAAFDSLASGNGQPGFYNEPLYLEALRSAGLGLAEADLVDWSGGGCTETMIHGCSNVGSLDAGINLPLILCQTLRRTLGQPGITFSLVMESFRDDARTVIRNVLGQLNAFFEARARHRPQPVRSLLMDDCIGRGRDFNDGGARYNWSIVNVAGLANAADSLEALRTVVFDEGAIAPGELPAIMECDFAGHEALRRRLAAAPKYGNDQPGVDALAAEIAEWAYCEIRAVPCIRGGRFLPSHIMFETFAWAGRNVGATPDGRRAGEPLADSAGPVQGRDTCGPTALLRSVASLPLHLAAGTPVLNLRFTKATLAEAEGRQRLRALIESYFRLGGMQVQVTVTDRAELEDALEHPERHENLIVRIGGYSTHFNRLSPELKREVLKRTEYALAG